MDSSISEISYVEEGGPGIAEVGEPAQFGEEHAQLEQEVLAPGWEQATVEQFLIGAGEGMHYLAGATEDNFRMTRVDLERIAPPLTRILNRYEPAVRASGYADPILVAYGFGMYGWREALKRQRALRDRQAREHPEASYQAAAAPDEEPPAAHYSDELGEELEDYTPYAQRRPEE